MVDNDNSALVPKPDRILPARIVVVHNEEAPRVSMAHILRHYFSNLEVLLFEDSLKAWAELAQKAPDLLITNDPMPALGGKEIVRRLAAERATFPIIVISSWDDTEKWVREWADQGLHIKFLSSPFDVTTFRQIVAASLNIQPDTDRAGQSSVKDS